MKDTQTTRTSEPGRRGSGAIRRLPDLRLASLHTSAPIVKSVAGLLVLAGVAIALAVPGRDTAAAVALPAADTALAQARTASVIAPASSRSLGRIAGDAAVPALAAPAQNAPQAGSDFGVAGVKAVAKPKPTPTPEVAALTNGGTTSTKSASSGGPAPANRSYSTVGSAIPGLTGTAARVYLAVKSAFGITNIGGYRAGDPGDHGSGRAVDVMISSQAQGDAVAAFAIANMGRLNIHYVIWRQRIWTTSSPYWRGMEDRGSPTANHYDPVHISVF